MSDAYADAVLRLSNAVDRAVVNAEADGLTPSEIAAELRLIADEVEADQ